MAVAWGVSPRRRSRQQTPRIIPLAAPGPGGARAAINRKIFTIDSAMILGLAHPGDGHDARYAGFPDRLLGDDEEPPIGLAGHREGAHRGK